MTDSNPACTVEDRPDITERQTETDRDRQRGPTGVIFCMWSLQSLLRRREFTHADRDLLEVRMVNKAAVVAV